MTDSADNPSSSVKAASLPAANDTAALRQAALDHMYIGMTNQTLLAEEGGPLIMESADGIYVTDIEGNRYIDGISGMYFRNAGHRRHAIATAVYDHRKPDRINCQAGSTPTTTQPTATPPAAQARTVRSR